MQSTRPSPEVRPAGIGSCSLHYSGAPAGPHFPRAGQWAAPVRSGTEFVIDSSTGVRFTLSPTAPRPRATAPPARPPRRARDFPCRRAVSEREGVGACPAASHGANAVPQLPVGAWYVGKGSGGVRRLGPPEGCWCACEGARCRSSQSMCGAVSDQRRRNRPGDQA